LRYASIVERRLSASRRFRVRLDNSERRPCNLVRELDIDADRATRLIIQLKDKPEIFRH